MKRAKYTKLTDAAYARALAALQVIATDPGTTVVEKCEIFAELIKLSPAQRIVEQTCCARKPKAVR